MVQLTHVMSYHFNKTLKQISIPIGVQLQTYDILQPLHAMISSRSNTSVVITKSKLQSSASEFRYVEVCVVDQELQINW
jgi:peptidase E